MTKTIDLSVVTDLRGLIIPEKSGVVYSNQVGGIYHLRQIQMEGIFIPLVQILYNENTDPLCVGHLECAWWDPSNVYQPLEEVAARCKKLVEEDGNYVSFLRYDAEYTGEHGEAWVPVIIHEDSHSITGFSGQRAILVYANCD